MSLEYTKKLLGGDFKSLRISLNENSDKIIKESYGDKYDLIIEKVKYNPNLLYKFEEFQLLTELASFTKLKWSDSTDILNVYFFGGQNERTKRVLDIASEWSEHCRITFKATNDINSAQIRVAFNEPNSWSYIGTDARGVSINEPTMNFGWLNDDTNENEWNRVVLHEFGHALGLIHEHQSPAAQIDWNRTYVYWYCQTFMKWTYADVDRNIFQEFSSTETNHSEVDTLSIMAYQIPVSFTHNGLQFPLNFELSEMDKKYIGKLYPKPTPKLLHNQ